MIKFIATDLDGTLLDENRKLPAGIFGLIEKLWKKGIVFAPASGRQYANMKKLFAPVADKVVFICENGALIKRGGETLHLNPIPDDLLKSALDKIRATAHVFPMLCGVDWAYIENDEQPFLNYAYASYDNCKLVNNLDGVIGTEPVCKIAIYDEISSAENCIKILPQQLPELRTILSGKDWCDVSAKGADKGDAVRFLRGYFSLKKEECAAFGDHMNDYEMLLECGHPFVTENAYPPLKELIGRTVPSNREGGAFHKIQEISEDNQL